MKTTLDVFGKITASSKLFISGQRFGSVISGCLTSLKVTIFSELNSSIWNDL